MKAPALQSFPATLSPADAAALSDLYRRGTPANTLRAWERDLIYITAWKRAAFGADLLWPEEERVALRFVLDHCTDLTEQPGPAQETAQETARKTAMALIGAGLRRTLACPAAATLDRRIASWRAFHRMKNLSPPFDAPLVAQARIKARAAAARPRVPKSPRPITRAVLEQLLASCDDSLRGLRDRAILSFGFASGGRRRSEIAALRRDDIGTEDFAAKGLVWVRLLETKTTTRDMAPRLPLKGRAARALIGWISAAEIKDAETGPLFRPISRAGRALDRALSPDGVRVILRHRLELAGLAADYATPHGLRSGFLTQAALDGVPVQAAMRLSLHRSAAQAQSYYADVEIADNPATDLLGDSDP